jgi:hypothetical protein
MMRKAIIAKPPSIAPTMGPAKEAFDFLDPSWAILPAGRAVLLVGDWVGEINDIKAVEVGSRDGIGFGTRVKKLEVKSPAVSVIPVTVLPGFAGEEIVNDKEDEFACGVIAGCKIAVPFRGGPLDMTGLPMVADIRVAGETLAKLVDVLGVGADVAGADVLIDPMTSEPLSRSGLRHRSCTPKEDWDDPKRVEV